MLHGRGSLSLSLLHAEMQLALQLSQEELAPGGGVGFCNGNPEQQHPQKNNILAGGFSPFPKISIVSHGKSDESRHSQKLMKLIQNRR